MGLEFKNVSFKYDEYKNDYALSNINASIDEGITALVGPSGSGKSTFLELIDGLLKPSIGSIKYDNKAIRKKDVGFVFQFPEDEFFNKTVREEVYFSLKNFKKDNESIEDLLKILSLDKDILNKKIDDLSNGEKRLVAILAGIIHNPKIILLDEPTVGLDYNNKKKIIKLINNLKNKYNKIIIIVSHDIDMLYEISDNIIILNEGKIEYSGNIMDCESKLFRPKIKEFEKKIAKKSVKILKRRCINDLIKEVYRNV